MPPFNILKGYFYFVKDLYFDYVQDANLSTNKKGTKRPAYYCFKDKQNSKILWFIPISSQYQKYENIYNDKIQKQLIKNPNKKPSVDTLVFDKIANKDSVFLIQNMFPVLEKYIDNIYIKNNSFVNISVTTKNEIDSKSNKVLKLLDKGVKGLVFSDIKRLKNLMIKELNKEIYLKELFDNNNIEYLDNVKDIFYNSINEEDIKLYINSISNLQIKNDINNIISNNLTIFDIKEEINKYIDIFSLTIKQNINIDIKDLFYIYDNLNDKNNFDRVVKMLDNDIFSKGITTINIKDLENKRIPTIKDLATSVYEKIKDTTEISFDDILNDIKEGIENSKKPITPMSEQEIEALKSRALKFIESLYNNKENTDEEANNEDASTDENPNPSNNGGEAEEDDDEEEE